MKNHSKCMMVLWLLLTINISSFANYDKEEAINYYDTKETIEEITKAETLLDYTNDIKEMLEEQVHSEYIEESNEDTNSLNSFDSLMSIAPEYLTSNLATYHSKEEITARFLDAKPKINFKNEFEVYDVIPNTIGPNYIYGILKNTSKADTLRILNFYRWLNGSKEVKIKEDRMSYNAKGAVLLSTSNFSHYPTKPADMDNSFFSDAIEGTALPKNYSASGNIFSGAYLPNTIGGYIDDVYNVNSNNISHRLSLLWPKATYTSFGSAGLNSCMTMYNISGDANDSEKFYSWPPSGYCPTEVTAKNEMWSITLNSNYKYDISNIDIKLDCNGNSYIVSKNDIYESKFYNSFFFKLPNDLNYLISDVNNYKSGVVIKVEISNGITNKITNAPVIIKYGIEFYNIEVSNFSLENIEVYGENIAGRDGYWTFDSLVGNVGNKKKLLMIFTPSNTTETEINVSFSNPEVASFDYNTNTIHYNKAGLTYCTISSIYNSNIKKDFTILVKDIVIPPKVLYSTHIQNEGWQNYVENGETSGTSGKGLRLEGIKIKLDSKVEGNIEYSTHIQNEGWQDFVQNDDFSGTLGRSLRLEGIKIRLTGKISEKYDIYYRVHSQIFGWLDWAKNGEEAGTSGYGYRLEGIQITLIEKGKVAPGALNTPFKENINVEYTTHIQNKGWQNYSKNGVIAGTTGEGLRLEGIKIKLDSIIEGNIEYSTHVQNEGWQEFRNNDEMSGSSGKSLRLEAIKIRLTGKISEKYDVYYRVHSQNFGWLDWAKNGEISGTSGYGYRLEGIEIVLIEKGKSSPGKTEIKYIEK